VYNYLAPLYEKQFIFDSYSCRVGKGTHFGIQRVKRFMRAASENFTKEAWILKLDIKGFFMAIDKEILYQIICGDILTIRSKCVVKNGLVLEDGLMNRPYTDWLLSLVHQIIFHDPTQNCIIRGEKADRIGLPTDKSLFSS
jgi:hypothetical protein